MIVELEADELTAFQRRSVGFSLTEMLVVIAIIGLTTLIGLPAFTDLVSRTKDTASRRTAQTTVSISTELSAMGVAHVLPESLGGVEATTRLLRHGIVIPDGPMQGKFFTIGGISDEMVESASVYMEILYQMTELQLGYNSSPE